MQWCKQKDMILIGCNDLDSQINQTHNYLLHILECKNSSSKTKCWRREIINFWTLKAPEGGRVGEKENLYNQLQKILEKTNKNNYT